MAINKKEMLVESLLKLCSIQSLEQITISSLLKDTGMSRQTFYNYFKDKNDLIQYVYTSRIVDDFNGDFDNFIFYDAILRALKNMQNYHHFMKQACLMNDQNCLKDYIFNHCLDFDIQWHSYLYGKEMDDTMLLVTRYHSLASSSMTLSWILSDCSMEAELIAQLIVDMRSVGMNMLGHQNPYRQIL